MGKLTGSHWMHWSNGCELMIMSIARVHFSFLKGFSGENYPESAERTVKLNGDTSVGHGCV